MGHIERERGGALDGVPAAEVALVGAMMLDAGVLDTCAEIVGAQDFSDRRLARLWLVAQRLHADGKPVDFTTMAEALELTGGSAGVDLLLELGDARATAQNAEHHARIVAHRAHQRRASQAIRAAAEAVEQADPSSGAAFERALQDAALAVDRACQRRQPDADRAGTLNQTLKSFIADTQERHKAFVAGTPMRTTITTGFEQLDQMIGGGLQLGGLYGIGAAEKVGKTALAMQLVEGAATAGWSALVFSYEVPNKHAAGRILAARAGVRNSSMLSGCLQDDEIDRMVGAVRAVAPWGDRVHLRFCPGTPVEYVCQEVRRFCRSSASQDAPLGLVIVDHLHCLARSPGGARHQSEDGHLREVVQALADLAAESGAAVLALSQHNRDRRTRTDARPRPTDIRGSAALVEKVWTLVQVHRPGADPSSDADPSEAALYVTANRYGGTGHVPVHFDGQRQRFELPRASWENR